MKIVQINATCSKGSTGKICEGISRILTANRIENYVLYASAGSALPEAVKYCDDRYIRAQAGLAHLTGRYGFHSKRATKTLIAKLESIRPDIVHLHNLHGHNCDLELLLGYLKARRSKVIWTFHDCWVFTAYCPHFAMAGCDRWKTGCEHCPQYKRFSFFFDQSRKLYQKKKQLLSGLDLTVVTPSQWLAGLVGESFLKDVPVRVIHNGIDLSVFQPTEADDGLRKRLSPDKHILLGVAFDWGVRKGLDVFTELAGRLDPRRYRIVLVGTNDKIDRSLPPEVLSVHRTMNQRELAALYTAADVFVNPTREEVFGLVNVEANACGTPVVTFRTGGSPECISERSGCVVAYNDIDAMEQACRRICEERPYSREDCIAHAQAFGQETTYSDYLKLYLQCSNT